MQWAISSLIALITGLGLVFIVIQLVGWYYNSKHPMAVGEEDLGFGLIAILIFTVSVICVIPIAGLVLWRSKKFMSKKYYKTFTN